MNFVFVLVLLVLAFVVVFLYAKLDEKIKKLAGKGFVEDVKKEIEGLIVEFNKVSNRKIVVIDEKIKELDKLIKLADEKIIKLDSMTRNYAEAIKRYELMKSEMEKLKTEYQKISNRVNILESKTRDYRVSDSSLESFKDDRYGDNELLPFGTQNLSEERIEPSQNKTRRKSKETIENTLPEITAFMSEKRFNKSEGVSSNEVVKKKVEYDVENMDFGERARLLEELLSKGLSDEELLEIGFTQSEIHIARAIQSTGKEG